MIWQWVDEDVRIATQPISYWESPALLLELAVVILRATTPLTTSKFQAKGEAMQAKSQEQLSVVDAEIILKRLPERIRSALIARAADIEYPIES